MDRHGEFKDIKIGNMYLWCGLHFVKTKIDYGEYSQGKEFYFFEHDQIQIDDKCIEYNKEIETDNENR